jgi:hypothetical protein
LRCLHFDTFELTKLITKPDLFLYRDSSGW